MCETSNGKQIYYSLKSELHVCVCSRLVLEIRSFDAASWEIVVNCFCSFRNDLRLITTLR